jgi:hypothetical protein
MKALHRLVFVLASAGFFIASTAEAQTPGSVTNHAFAIGKGAGVAGYSSLLCSSGQIPVGQTSADPQCKTLSGDVSLNSSGATAIAPGAANTFKGTLDGTTTSNISLTACSAVYQITKWVSGTGWQCGINPLLPSRATASTLDLSAHSVIKTMGYATAGDGGGATFIKTSGRFTDTFVSTGSITNGGTGYTNGTYTGVSLVGSATGLPTYANITVSGGAVTSVTIINIYGLGAGSLAGDVLSTSAGNIGGTGSGFTWTISAMTSASASFTDSAGNRWQYVVDSGSFINPRQFGCKFDWVGTDASATNDGDCLQAAINFSSVTRYNRQDFGGTFASSRVVLPAGSALICQTLVLPAGAQLFGQGPFNSVLKVCDSGLSITAHVIEACDKNGQLACFGTQIGQLGINAFNASGDSGAFVIYSNAVQQNRFIDNVQVYSGTRGCYKYEIGYGGAANANVYDFFCTINTGSSNAGIQIENTGALMNHKNIIVESGGSGLSGIGYNVLAGIVVIDGYHSEGITNPVNVNITTTGRTLTLMHGLGGFNCTDFVTLQSTNTAGNFAMYNVTKNGCTRTVANAQSGGSSRTNNAVPADGWVSFNP